MNAPALLAEMRDLSARCRAGDAATVINLSLLPVTPEDLTSWTTMLGRSGLSVLSRGFGNCRITATAYPHVWWVQYFNSMEKLILNSIEVVDLPAVALAAAEDYRRQPRAPGRVDRVAGHGLMTPRQRRSASFSPRGRRNSWGGPASFL